MIRKISSIISMIALMLTANITKAQICTPDTNLKIPGFMPTSLPDGKVNTPYSQGITVKTFKDTTVKLNGLTVKVYIDSMKITNFTGFPNGINYQCLNSRCVFTPSTLSCIKISGTPTQSGVFPLKAYIKIFAKVSGVLPQTTNDSISSYVLTITGSSANIHSFNLSDVLKAYPNPASQSVLVNSVSKIYVYNALGQIVDVPMVAFDSYTHLDISKLKGGIYQIHSQGKSVKLLVE